MLKNWKKYVFFLFLVAVVVIIVLYFQHRHKSAPVHAYAPPPAQVKLAHVKIQMWPTILQGSGTVTAQQGVVIRAQVSGEILQQFVRSSMLVKAGDSLYEIDPQGLAQLIKQNQAEVILKKEQLEEQRKLFAKGFVAKNDFDTAEEAYKVALDTLKQNKRRLVLTRVVAPFSGKLGVLLVHRGDYVNVNTPLVSLQDPNKLRVDFTLPGNFANLPQVGQLVTLEVLQYPKTTFRAKVTSVNASVDPQSQSILVRAYLQKAAQVITPGSFANVQLYVNTGRPVATVPDTALVYSDEGVAVYNVVNGVAHITPVEVGQRIGNWVEILRGIKVGDTVVSEGKVKLMDGAKVQG